jgi:hypothetical protein
MNGQTEIITHAKHNAEQIFFLYTLTSDKNTFILMITEGNPKGKAWRLVSYPRKLSSRRICSVGWSGFNSVLCVLFVWWVTVNAVGGEAYRVFVRVPGSVR